jgi:hypothetical protein
VQFRRSGPDDPGTTALGVNAPEQRAGQARRIARASSHQSYLKNRPSGMVSEFGEVAIAP